MSSSGPSWRQDGHCGALPWARLVAWRRRRASDCLGLRGEAGAVATAPCLAVATLLIVASVAAISAAGCAALAEQKPTGDAQAATTGAPKPATVAPLSPLTLRQVLPDSGSAFAEGFRLLPDDQVEQVVRRLPGEPRELRELRDGLLAARGAAQIKAAVLELGEDKMLTFAGTTARAEVWRHRFLTGVTNETLRQVAVNLAEVEKERVTFCEKKRPRIHNIGLQSFLTFEAAPPPGKETTTRQRAVRIPVDGRDLHPRCVTLHVQITGTIPLSRHPWETDFFVTRPKEDRPDTANILLLEGLIDRLKTGDQLTVQIVVAQHASFTGGDEARLVSFATRTFTLYEVEYFRRRVLSTRIGPHDIRAFPLPEADAELLFGLFVARQFFVVRLSVRNTEPEAKLISTGMITASGRAIVEPAREGEPSFTVPITVVPSSLQQTFTILDDEESNQPRAWVFRGLEFVGALAAAVTSGFGFAPGVLKGVSLFTGVGIPEGKRFVPDRWPGYKRNVVTYGVPDLIKVPSNSVTDHRFLFFPKKDVELVIADHNIFADPLRRLSDGKKPDLVERLDRTGRLYGRKLGSLAPGVRVISLAFDNLEIRFEKVVDVARLGTREEIAALLEELPRHLDLFETIDRNWLEARPAAAFIEGFTIRDWQRVTAAIAQVNGAQEARTDSVSPAKAEVLEVLGLVAAVADAFRPARLQQELTRSPDVGLERLHLLRTQLTQISRRITAGVDPEAFAAEVKGMREALAASRAAREFYVKATLLLAGEEFEEQLSALKGTAANLAKAAALPADQAEEKAKQMKAASEQIRAARKALLGKLEMFRLARPSDKLMARVDWVKVKELFTAVKDP